MNSKRSLLEGYKLKPFYVLKKGDLVKVKNFERELGGMVGVIMSREDYGTSCMVLLSNGKKRNMMNFCLERMDEEYE